MLPIHSVPLGDNGVIQLIGREGGQLGGSIKTQSSSRNAGQHLRFKGLRTMKCCNHLFYRRHQSVNKMSTKLDVFVFVFVPVSKLP